MSHSKRAQDQLQFTFPANTEEYAPWVATYGLRAPYGECQCGCGNRTRLARANRPAQGEAKGKPCRHLKGHWANKYPLAENPNPSGLCLCGCGQAAPISKVTRNKSGYVKGQPVRYVPGHGSAKQYAMEEPNPSGLCLCGCGNPTPLAKETSSERGLIKGKPTRWINGHHPSIVFPKDRSHLSRPLMERFWEKVNRGGPDDCWEWMGCRNGAGYGKIGRSGNSRYAHRISYEMAYGAIPENLLVCHRCDNPSCVNPNHLFAGSNLDNALDMVSKGRAAYQKAAFLDIEAMEQMRVDGYGYRSIGAQFGIPETRVGKIAKLHDWRRRFGTRGLR